MSPLWSGVLLFATLLSKNVAAPDRLISLDRDRIIFPSLEPKAFNPFDLLSRFSDPLKSFIKTLNSFVDNESIDHTLFHPDIEQEYVTDNVEEKVSYEGAQVWNVNVDRIESLRVISTLSKNHEVATWGGNHTAVDFMIRSHKLDTIAKLLSNNNIRYRVVIEDLQKYIDDENPQIVTDDTQDRKAKGYKFWQTYRTKGRISMPVMKPTNRKMASIGAYMGYNSLDGHMEYWPDANWGHRMTWQQYHRLGDIHGFLDYLATTYPQFCSVNTIGRSVEGRELKVLRISTGGENKKAVWIDGGIHAREWISPATVTYLINHLVENFENESEAVRDMEWYFLPVLNPDGYEYTHTTDRLWRKNRKRFGKCNGVDLNRNFGYKWGGQGTSKNQCSEIYAGESAFSEPESTAVEDFFKSSNSKFNLYLSYHSYGQYILYPWGYERIPPADFVDLDSAGKQAAHAITKAGGSNYRVGVSSILLYPAAGGSDDWAKGSMGVKYSYTIELSDTGRYGFVLPASYITKVAKESLAAMRVLAEAAYAA